jgi:hypothetical protein
VIRSNLIKSTMVEQQQAGDSLDDGAVLAAVLAAALVEYGRHLEQPGRQGSSKAAGSNWRLLACLDRMQGRA